MRTLLTGIIVAILLASMGCAFAAEVTYTGSLPLSTTNWSNSISIPKFNPSLGTLDRITFVLTGYVEGSAKYESLDTVETNVTADLSAKLTLMRPDSSVIVVSIPLSSTTETVAAFDGTIDFSGASGRKHEGLSASRSETVVASAPSPDLALFTGTGSIALPVSAVGASAGSGAGNLFMQFNTLASANASVTYEYRAVPEPSGILALLTGVAGLATWTLRRRSIS